MANTPQPFSLSEEAKQALKEMLRKATHPTRARILLKLNEGLGPTQIAREVDVHPNTVINVRNRANERGWNGVIEDQLREGRPPDIQGRRAQITTLACSDPPQGRQRWTLRLLAHKAVELGFIDSISHESVREILKKSGSSRT